MLSPATGSSSARCKAWKSSKWTVTGDVLIDCLRDTQVQVVSEDWHQLDKVCCTTAVTGSEVMYMQHFLPFSMTDTTTWSWCCRICCCKLAPGYLATISYDLTYCCGIIKTDGVQCAHIVMTGDQTMTVFTTWLSARQLSWLHKHASHCHGHNFSLVSSVAHSIGTRKLVCNKWKSVLTEFILTVLSHI